VTAVLHAVKAALAAVLAWLLADGLLHLPQPFLAPYAAAFLIESTVYRSLRSSAQQVAAVATAVLLVFAVQRLVPSMPLAVGITVLSGLLIGKLRFYGDAGVWVALTAVVVLTADNPDTLLVDRLVETALGALIGTAVNALVIPPRYRKWARTATNDTAAQVHRTLQELAVGLRDGEQHQDAPDQVDAAIAMASEAEKAVEWSVEAERMNLRPGPGFGNDLALRLRRASPHLLEIAEILRADRRKDDELAALLDELAEVVRRRQAGRPTEEETARALVANLRPRLGGVVVPAERLLDDLTR
jgi:uncharacterized membrane protein (UPF0136 family)